jgi:hypothetical protein
MRSVGREGEAFGDAAYFDAAEDFGGAGVTRVIGDYFVGAFAEDEETGPVFGEG